MINIELNRYLIKSDSLNYILYKKVKSKGNKNKLSYKTVGYFGSTEQLIKRLLELELMESDSKTLKELENTIKSVADEITERIKSV